MLGTARIADVRIFELLLFSLTKDVKARPTYAQLFEHPTIRQAAKSPHTEQIFTYVSNVIDQLEDCDEEFSGTNFLSDTSE